jgi:hypothetical protein
MNNATTEERMALAMSELSKQTKPNIMEASKKYQVNRTTLSQRFKGIQQSRAQFLSKSQQCLTITVEGKNGFHTEGLHYMALKKKRGLV